MVWGVEIDADYFAHSDLFYGDQILLLSQIACPAKVSSVNQNTLSNMGVSDVVVRQTAWAKSRLHSVKFGTRGGCWTTVIKAGEEWVLHCNAYADGLAGDECAVLRKDSFKLSNGMPAASLIRRKH
jgi:hypothetical protein